jgi:hypothetical protein
VRLVSAALLGTLLRLNRVIQSTAEGQQRPWESARLLVLLPRLETGYTGHSRKRTYQRD